MSFFKKLSLVVDKLSACCEKIGYFMSMLYGGVVFLLVFSGVILRMLFSLQASIGIDLFRPLPWSEELSRWVLIALAFVSSSVAFKRGEHVGIELIVDKFPENLRRLTAVLTDLIVIIFLFFCFKTSLTVAIQGQSQTGDIIPLSMFWVKMNLPLGFAFMIVHACSNLLQNLTIKKRVVAWS